MATASSGSWLDYIITDFWEINGDPLAKHLPWTDRGPWRIFSVIAVYLFFVLYAGPRFMKVSPL